MGAIKLNSYYEEEEKPLIWTKDVKEQIKFLTDHIQMEKPRWFIGRMENGELKSHTLHHKWELEKLEITDEEVYITLLPFKNINGRIRRTSNYVGENSLLWVDLDMKDPMSTMDFIMNELDEIEEVPPPSAILFSGVGAWLLWRTEPIPTKQWEKLMNVINKRMKPFGADGQAKDRIRYHRLVGTKNQKSGQTVSMQIKDEYLYTLEDFRRYLGLSEEWLEGKNIIKPTETKKRARKTVRILPTFYNLNNTRLADLDEWLKMRNYDIEGYRNVFIHLYGVELRLADSTITRPALERVLLNINNSLAKPNKVSEVRATTNCLYRRKYKYKSETIIEKLDISSEEQQKLKTIISKEEKQRRNTIAKRVARGGTDMDTYRKQQEKDKDMKIEQLKELRDAGIKMKDILIQLKISKATYSRLLKEVKLKYPTN